LVTGSLVHDCQPPSEKGFSLEAAFRSVVHDGLIRDLCNSFLYIASREEPLRPLLNPDVLAAHYGGARDKEFCQETLFVRQDGGVCVKKRRLYPDPGQGMHSAPVEANGLINTLEADAPYRHEALLCDSLLPIVNTPGWRVEQVALWAAPWLEYLRSLSVGKDEAGRILLPPDCLDMAPFNCFAGAQGSIQPFDVEWAFADKKPLPFSFVALRGLFLCLGTVIRNFAPTGPDVPVSRLLLAVKTLNVCGIAVDAAEIDFFCRHFAFDLQNAVTPEIVLHFRVCLRELA
jgi:hypothetical protein